MAWQRAAGAAEQCREVPGAYTGETTELQTVCAVEEVTEEDPQPRPSIVLRRPRPGECLWNIAKEHSSSEEAIRQCNHLEDDTLPEGMLLIPVLKA